MKKESVLLVVCFVMILSTTFAKSAFGGAMDSSSIGVKSWMMASAVTGIADDSSAVHWNPAGLVFHEDQEKSWHAQTYAIVFFNAKMKFESKYGIRDSSETDTILPGFLFPRNMTNGHSGLAITCHMPAAVQHLKIFKGPHLMLMADQDILPLPLQLHIK